MAEKGSHGTTIQEITELADVAFGSFYNHFESKGLILDAVIEEALELHGATIDQLTEGLSDPAEVIATALRGTLAISARDPVWAWLLLRAGPAQASGLRRLRRRTIRDLQVGADRGRFQVAEPQYTALILGGAALAVMGGRLRNELPRAAETTFVEHALRMLGISVEEAHEISRRIKVSPSQVQHALERAQAESG